MPHPKPSSKPAPRKPSPKAPAQPEPKRPIDDGRLTARTAAFIRMTGGRGKPHTYGTGKTKAEQK